MTTYIALLRGINLGQRKRIAMGDLRELIASLGHENVRTHIVSGNVIFDSSRSSVPQLESQIEDAIRDRFRLEVRVLVRTADELAAIVDGNPFPDAADHGSQMFALILDRNPDKERFDRINPATYRPEEFRLGDRVIYAWYKRGLQGSRLARMLSDKRLDVTITARNWNTITKLLELATEPEMEGDA